MSAAREEAPVADEKTEQEAGRTQTFEQLVKEQRNGGLAAELSEQTLSAEFGDKVYMGAPPA